MTLELTTLKALLGITDTAYDAALQFVLDDITETICNYCHVDELPSGLTNTAYRMAIDIYRAEGIGSTTAPTGTVSSIKEGDVTVSFARLTSEGSYTASVLKQYAEPILFGIDREAPEYLEAKRLLKFLDYFLGVDSTVIPANSLLREFIGGGCFRV